MHGEDKSTDQKKNGEGKRLDNKFLAEIGAAT